MARRITQLRIDHNIAKNVNQIGMHRMPIGKRIRGWRVTKQMSQRELARRLGVNPSRVCDWERGKRCPTATRIEDIAIALGLTVAGFYRPERASKDDQTRRGESENVESAENRG